MIIAVDIGTSSCKGCGFDNETLLPITSWMRRIYNSQESNPKLWYETCVEIMEAIANDPKATKPPAIVVLSGMMQNVILPQEDFWIPYHDASYAIKANEALTKKGIPTKLRKLTGNYKESASIVAKLHRLQFERRFKQPQPVLFGAHSYVAWRLLNIKDEGLLCDPTTASTTGLIETASNNWISTEMLTQAGIGKFVLPRLLSDASRIVGHVFMEERRESKLNGLPLVHGSGDLGSLVAAVDRWGFSTHAYLGTSGWIARVVPKTITRSQEMTFVLAHPLDSTKIVHAMPTTCAGFNASKWASTLFNSDPFTLDAKAANADVNKSTVLYLPYLKGERAPMAMPQARAAFIGLNGDTTTGEMSLAVLCGVAYQFRWLLGSFDSSSNNHYKKTGHNGHHHLCLLGGGSGSAIWRQIFADVLNVPVRTLHGREELDETVWGAACIAQHGRQQKTEFPESMWVECKPKKDVVKRHDEMFGYWLKAATDLKDVFITQRKSAKL